MTVTLAGFAVIAGAEVWGRGTDGSGLATKELEQPAANKTGIVRSIESSGIDAQRGRGFGSRGQGCLNKRCSEILKA